MSDQSKIEWTDSTFNPWEGCTKVGPGCDHCYAEARNNRFHGGNWGPGAPRRRTSETNWWKPLKWNREAFFQCPTCGWRGDEKGAVLFVGYPRAKIHSWICPTCTIPTPLVAGRRRVFCASLADWLDNEVPIEWLVDLLDLIRQTPNLDWLCLSKRIGNWYDRLEQANNYILDHWPAVDAHPLCDWIIAWLEGAPPKQVWLGATIVNQAEADRDIPKLLQVPARVRFLSMEPLLGPVNLGMSSDGFGALVEDHDGAPYPGYIDWVIAGGESGHHARPMHPDWVRSLRDQCQAADIPFLFKQWGEWAPYMPPHPENADLLSEQGKYDYIDGEHLTKLGKKKAGRHLDGRTWDQFPDPESTP